MTEANSTPRNSPILVCGAHRTGTTWVGKMLSASGETGYISEPLNVLHRPGIYNTPTRFWYTYICAENEAEYLPGLQKTLQFKYHALDEARSLRSLKDLGRMGRDWSSFLHARARNLRPLLKDPFAVFSSLWFATRLGCQVVITIRHPAAFVSSLKRLEWPFQLQDLLDQPLLMQDWLEPFRPEIEQVASDPSDAIGQNSLLWRLVYSVVENLLASRPDFILVRHEDLSLDPLEGFGALYAGLGLAYTEEARRKVRSSTNSENPGELKRSSAHAVRLDSRANLDNWKRRLSAAEIGRIRQITEETALHFYSDLSWN